MVGETPLLFPFVLLLPFERPFVPLEIKLEPSEKEDWGKLWKCKWRKETQSNYN